MDRQEKIRTKVPLRPGVDASTPPRLVKSAKSRRKRLVCHVKRDTAAEDVDRPGDETWSPTFLKFNQLKFRRKAMKFGKSAITTTGVYS